MVEAVTMEKEVDEAMVVGKKTQQLRRSNGMDEAMELQSSRRWPGKASD